MPKKKTSSKKASKAKKTTEKKEKKMMETHAKEEKFVKTTLDQVWGDTGNTKYGTIDEAAYLNKLNGLNTTDLQAHAHMHGLVPIQDRGRLTKALVSEFRKYVSAFKVPPPPNQAPPSVSEESARTLAEGR